VYRRAVQSVAVFCGSQAGRGERYRSEAVRLGTALAARGVGLVYGGGKVGLMGVLADSVLAGGGHVVGVIPQMLVDREVAHTGVTELCVVQTMHERKALMAERADAFVAMPGGIGTLEEIIEILSWAQLSIHDKPCAFLDTDGYYRGLVSFFDHMVTEGFVLPEARRLLSAYPDPESLLDALSAGG
jgi:uncharacterized protein (TIGR00730 family)